jgi:hypothetical protein
MAERYNVCLERIEDGKRFHYLKYLTGHMGPLWHGDSRTARDFPTWEEAVAFAATETVEKSRWFRGTMRAIAVRNPG